MSSQTLDECKGCKRDVKSLFACPTRTLHFSVHQKKCPRELALAEKIKALEEATKPRGKLEVIAEVDGDRYLELPPELIYWKDPIRKTILEKDVNDLATSFSMHGQIEPIVVTGPNEQGMYEGICGRLRYEGMKRLHGRPILARVHQFKDESEKREWQLAENLHRRELTEIQRDEAIKELYEVQKEKFSDVEEKHILSTVTQRIEELTGEKPAERSVRKRLQIVSELPKEVKNTVTGDRDFGIRHAEQLLRLKNMPEKQLELARIFSRKPMTVQQLKKKVNEVINPPSPKPKSIDTGLKFDCPVCGETYVIIHVDEGKHRFEKITVMDSEH